MRALLAVTAGLLSLACSAAPAPGDAPAPGSSAAPAASARPSVSVDPAVPLDFATCGIAPMSLVIHAPGGRELELLTLEADGRVLAQGFGSSLEARIDAQGCLRGPDGLWAELTPSGSVWTPHALMQADTTGLRLPDGVRHELAADGHFTRIEADGTRASGEYGRVGLRGYRHEAQCSAVLLYTAMLSMMPSMAVVDGVARREPPPTDTRCAATAAVEVEPPATTPSASPRAPR